MNFFLSLFNAMPGAVTQGMLWGIRAIGVYITSRILDVADLPVDGSLATGGAVCVMLMRAGWNPWIALLCAFLAGVLAGLCTGLLHTRCGIPAILAGILTQLALYSVNLRIMGGKANQPIGVDKYDLLVSQRYVRELTLSFGFARRSSACGTGSSAPSTAAPFGPPAPTRTWPGLRASTPSPASPSA